MTEIQKNNRIKKRISLAISEGELIKWELNNKRDSLSAFIREAVNEYIKIRNPGQYSNLMDELLQQNSKQSERIEKIERDLIEIRAAIAKRDIIPDSDQIENQILNYIKRKLEKEDITDEIKRILENYKDSL